MGRRFAVGLGAALFTLAAAGVLIAGPLTARAALTILPALAEVPSALLAIVR